MTTFSLVTAVYGVERYLDAFIESLEEQTYPHERIQIVAVDDGSTDGSLDRLRLWAAEGSFEIVVLTKENGGQASARNLGLDHATGDWITFTDPDDRLDARYFATMAAFLERHPGTDVAAAAFWMLDDATGELSNTHPLRARFNDGNILRDLSVFGDYFFGSAHAGFFRRSRLEKLGLRFDTRIRPNFEDGHFTSLYLLDLPAPKVGFVRSAHYHYRKRDDGSSTMQKSLLDPRRYTDALRYGHLDLLQRAAASGGVPRWLAGLIVYELSWYLSLHDARDGRTAAKGEVAAEFHRLLGEIVALLPQEVIDSFAWRQLKPHNRALLLHGYDAQPWHATEAVIDKVDRARRLMRLSYLYTGTAPSERLLVGGTEVRPRYAKIRDHVSHDQVRVHERLLWVPTTVSARLQLEGRDVQILPEPRRRPHPTVRPLQLQRLLDPTPSPLVPQPERTATPAEERLLETARGRRARKYADAWVLIDRIHDADDSAEHLFHHLRAHHREVNAWFVLEQGTPDWERLRRTDKDRLVAFGSEEWKLLMLNAEHLVSSHPDTAVSRPPALGFAAPTWRTTFLQHGVIKDDLSGWLNRRPLDVFVTSTPAEHASIVGDHTGYTYTDLETVMTGLPRFDRLLEAGRQVGRTRDLVLVAPTWRFWLIPPQATEHQRREGLEPGFLASEFVQRWTAFLRSPELAEACRRHGLTLGFLPHPNLQQALPLLDLPDHVQPLRFEGTDVRRLVARSALLVTDYSSMAFNAAYIDRPVLYYQFDADRVLAGDHVGGRGYFDYERDGFGPVLASHEAAVAAAVAQLDAGPEPLAPYAARTAATFPLRDGGCCERVTQAILASARPVTDAVEAGGG
ncbi:CDP-glycerol glycerophosphotransferase family protein [Nocardioides sp. BP30]|uniref:bifunctional glycosyltransferase/CDP-glycerol:glycerophosphate glycerophosphotransferase n=1 Tax=Nocardioides sp. BP30 TaxID=3036374 RepID=UPI0024695905|nr:CDP-glycerol glycerophosphotransferase family protein [Nocardioides sp. BP30]WGL52882.1 CDP-glycerol glycerophosphotransferase family protein [Nocardioides sp. BP30]